MVDLFIELFIASPDLLQPNNNQHNNNESYWAIEHPRAQGPCQCCASASVRTLSLQSVESQQAARHHQWPVDKPIQCTSVATPHSIHQCTYTTLYTLLSTLAFFVGTRVTQCIQLPASSSRRDIIVTNTYSFMVAVFGLGWKYDDNSDIVKYD